MQSLLLASALLMTGPTMPQETRATARALMGTWSFVTSNHWKKGVCPAPRKARGRLRIVKRGRGARLKIIKGMICKPASMCRFSCKVLRAKIVCTNRARVDNEGGVARNRVVLRPTSRRRAAGTNRSTYTHPGGMKCSWGFKVSLRKIAGK